MSEDKDLQSALTDMFDILDELNQTMQSMEQTIKNIPNAMMLKGMESSILVESQRQHNDLAAPEDIDRLERRMESLFAEVKSKLDHIEHDHLPQGAAPSTVDLIKAVQEGAIQTKRLENDREDSREEHQIEEKKIDGRLSHLKEWFKFWPIFLALMFEFLRWAIPHIHSIVGNIGG